MLQEAGDETCLRETSATSDSEECRVTSGSTRRRASAGGAPGRAALAAAAERRHRAEAQEEAAPQRGPPGAGAEVSRCSFFAQRF